MPQLGTAQVIRADSRNLPLADNSVDLVVTSPPYFALRSYQDTVDCAQCRHLKAGVGRRSDWERNLREAFPDYEKHVREEHKSEHYAGQIGSEPTPAEFVDALLEVTRECVRVLKPSGSLWVNLGDKYATGATPGPQSANTTMTGGAHKGVYNVVSRKVRDGVRPKSLIGIPWRYALRCIDDLGLILRAEVIWSKPNGLPESVTDRVRRSHEQWFHFTLEPRYFSAVDEIREEHDQQYAQRRFTPSPPRAKGNHDGEGGWTGVMRAEKQVTGHPLGKLPGSVWSIPTEPLRVPDHLGIDHFAAFPTEWPRRIIQGWSPAGVCVECSEGRRPTSVTTLTRDRGGSKQQRDWNPAQSGGDGTTATLGREREVTITGYACACLAPTADTTPAVVLDPFGGTGTTALVAKALGRHGISVDMSADYCRLAEWRTNDRNQLAKVLGIEKAEQPDADQLELFEETA